MRAKLFGGKPPRDGQNSGGVHFVEKKRHAAERKPPWLFRDVLGEKTARGGKMRAKLFGGKPFGTDEILVVWILYRENGTGRKESLQDCSGESRAGPKNGRGVFVEKTARGGKMRAKLFGGKPPQDGQNSGGVDYMEWRRHGAERKPPRLFRVGVEKTVLGQANCGRVFVEKTARGGKMRAKLFGGKPPRDGQNSGGVDFMEWRRHGVERKPQR
ncbi:hypothetical protein T11_16080, partial [Trichinella zimbabwensis]